MRAVRDEEREKERGREKERDRIARTLLTCGSSPRGYVVTFTMSVFVVAHPPVPTVVGDDRRGSARAIGDLRTLELQESATLGRHPLVVVSIGMLMIRW